MHFTHSTILDLLPLYFIQHIQFSQQKYPKILDCFGGLGLGDKMSFQNLILRWRHVNEVRYGASFGSRPGSNPSRNNIV